MEERSYHQWISPQEEDGVQKRRICTKGYSPMENQSPIWFKGDNILQMQLLQQVAYRAQIQFSESSGYRQHDSPNAGLLLSPRKRTKRNMWSLLASFAVVTGINGYSPSFMFTKVALGKWFIKFELANAFDFFKPNALQLVRSTYEQNLYIG